MRFLILPLFGLLFFSCVFQAEHAPLNLNGVLSLQQARVHLPGHHFGGINSVRVMEKSKELRVKDGIVTHGRFLYLERLEELGADYLDNFTNEAADFGLNPDLVKVCHLRKSRFDLKYENYVGHTIRVYNSEREQTVAKMSRLVIVRDPQEEIPYLAVALSAADNADFHYTWANSNKRLNAFPFERTEDPVLTETALIYFDSLSEYHRVRDEVKVQTSIEYEDVEMYPFKYRKDEYYVFVQYSAYGSCSWREQGYSALYHVTPQNWSLEAEGYMPYFFSDLIDIDGDQYPELLMDSFSETAIFEINYSGFHKRKSAGWWTETCPC